jgi:MFS family permease
VTGPAVTPPAAPAPAGGDVPRLFLSRAVRLFAYGALSVVLVLHLAACGLSEARIGLLLTLTLLGDTALSLVLTTRADLAGRRRMLLAGAALMVGAGLLFAVTRDFWVLLLAATLGIISPSGNEVGPFLAIEQAALSQAVPAGRRTHAFAWYTLTGSFATAAGALVGGGLSEALQRAGWAPLASTPRSASGSPRSSPASGPASRPRPRAAPSARRSSRPGSACTARAAWC